MQGDLFAADLSKATVVTLWLSETVNARLEEKLKRELKPGARIVSHQFPIGKWLPDKQIVVEGEDVFSGPSRRADGGGRMGVRPQTDCLRGSDGCPTPD